MQKLVPVLGAEVIADHVLRVAFGDGIVGDVDFTARQWSGVSAPLADPAFFAQARVDPEIRTVAWPNGYDIAPETLYEHARRHPAGTSASSAAA